MGNRKSTRHKIVIFGQLRTGTTALFLKIRQSLLDANFYELFAPQAYSPSLDDTHDITLTKVILGETQVSFDRVARAKQHIH